MVQKIYSKHDFWEKNFKMCLSCKETKIISKEIALERDPDGRSRGMTEFTCKVRQTQGQTHKTPTAVQTQKYLHALDFVYT